MHSREEAMEIKQRRDALILRLLEIAGRWPGKDELLEVPVDAELSKALRYEFGPEIETVVQFRIVHPDAAARL